MKARDLIGYLIGLILFVVLIPLIMWRLSGDVNPGAVRIIKGSPEFFGTALYCVPGMAQF